VRQAAREGRTPILLALPEVLGDPDAIRISHIFEAAARDEAAVRQVLDEVGRYLGIGIANLLNAFNPSLFVLGGVLSLAGPYLLPRAQRETDARALSAARDNVQIKLSAFKFDACVMGGVSLLMREILNNPAAWKPAS
jgi:predicted NBD/HSP70 family sugar kinase